MKQLAIIADDLTGALDAAAPFVGAGRTVAVATSPASLQEVLTTGAEVIAVSTRSRDVEAAKAREIVGKVIAALPADIGYFKKIDSRLKGHIEAELSAFPQRPLLVCPAIPEIGRYTTNSCVIGFGIDHPIPVASRLGTLAQDAILPDAQTLEDLVACLHDLPEGGLPVGARGLSAALAKLLFGDTGPAAPIRMPEPSVLLVGSTDPVTLAQVASLKSARPETMVVTAPGGEVPLPEMRPQTLTLIRATAEGPPRRSEAVALSLARGMIPWLKSARTIFASGGATAEALFDGLGATVLTLLGEAAPGIPVCVWNGRYLITKSGGFGAPDALARIFPAVVEV